MFINSCNTAILGAGASGLFLASMLSKKDYILIDHNIYPMKIKVSGGGKCNFTNEFVSSDNYTGDKKLIKKVLQNYSSKDVLKFFQDVKYKKIKNSQYFASSSNEIIKKLEREKFIAEILGVSKEKEFTVYTSKGNIKAKNVVVATGGISYKKLGATDIGYKIAKDFGHTIISPTPALVGLSLQKEQFWMKELSGVSLKAKVEVEDKIFEDDILFSHRGITGPAILNTSLYWKKGKIRVNFLPNFKLKKSNKTISNLLPLPKRFTISFLKAHGFSDLPADKSKQAVKLLKNYEFAPAGNFGFERAEVTKGGVDTDELSGLESKFVKNLFFIGEVVNVTGELGGYNFQWCFSSAKYISRYLSFPSGKKITA